MIREKENNIIIKKVSKDDFAEYAHLRHKLWPQDSVLEHIDTFTDLYLNHLYHAFIAYINGEAVGFAEISIRPFVNGCLHRPVGFLEGIWVAPEHQRRNIGAQMLYYCEVWAKDEGAQEIGSDAYLENTACHHAHKSWGFEETKKVVYFRKKLWRPY